MQKIERNLREAFEGGAQNKSSNNVDPSQVFSDYKVMFQKLVTLEFDQNPNASRNTRDEMVTQFLKKSGLVESPQLFGFFKGKLDDTWKGRRSYCKRKVRKMILAKTTVPNLTTLKEGDDEEFEKMWNNLSKDQELQDITELIGSPKWSKDYTKYIQSCVRSWIEVEKQECLKDKTAYIENLPIRRQEARSPK